MKKQVNMIPETKIIKVGIGKNNDDTKGRKDLEKIAKIELLDKAIKSVLKN